MEKNQANKFFDVIFKPSRLILALLHRTSKLWSDKLFLQIKYRLVMGTKLDLKNPKTFNEKLQWLKLYNRKSEYTTMVDKYAVKEYVASKIGEEYIIPTLGVWDTPDDIDWDSLPDQFVLKTTHGGGGCGVVICRDKSSFDKDSVKRVLERSLRSDIFWYYREWPYKNVPKRIIAEKYMTDGGKELEDYKVHNFNGIPKIILVCRERFKDSPMIDDFYSDKWDMLDIKRPGHPNTSEPIECPEKLVEMLNLSRILSKDIPFLRTDFYTIENRIYFGELTFFPASGMSAFEPEQWDETLGNWVKLPLGGGKWLIYKKDVYLLVTDESSTTTEQLKDYKFFCFNGRVRCYKVDFDRFIMHRANYYNRDSQLLPFCEVAFPADFSKDFEKPINIDKMIELAEILAKDIPFSRVDFYNINGKIFFGEITFFPAAGMGKFEPEEWDKVLGDWMRLPLQ